jgi:hypothetical protein
MSKVRVIVSVESLGCLRAIEKSQRMLKTGRFLWFFAKHEVLGIDFAKQFETK